MTDFHPSWLRKLTPEARAEVVSWIESHGINSNHCAAFAISGERIKFHMYKFEANGRFAMLGEENLPIFEDMEMKRNKDLPSAVRSKLQETAQ